MDPDGRRQLVNGLAFVMTLGANMAAELLPLGASTTARERRGHRGVDAPA